MHTQREALGCRSAGSGIRTPCTGTVAVICGCMFSGKTSELLRRLSTLSESSVVAIKHVIDDRYRADALVTHDGATWPAFPIASPAKIISYVRPETRTVAVDEAHFFDLSLIDVVRELTALGKHVIATSLDRDSWGRPFVIAQRLMKLAAEPITKYAVCARCSRVADRTQRLTPIINGNMVGGPESYEPRCLSCWAPPPETPSY